MELELNNRRLVSIWWLIIWRGLVIGVLIGMVVGAIVGFLVGVVMAMTMHPLNMVQVQQTARIASLIVCIPLGIVWHLFVLRMAFKKRYKDFRIVLVPLDAAGVQ